MSAQKDSDGDGFAAPAFQAATALAQLQRALRDLKLAEMHGGFEFRSRRVAELTLAENAVQARLVRRLALTPEWDSSSLKSAAEQRKWLDELKKRLARWQNEE